MVKAITPDTVAEFKLKAIPDEVLDAVYEKAGWKVSYDKPGYNESYDPYFKFTAK